MVGELAAAKTAADAALFEGKTPVTGETAVKAAANGGVEDVGLGEPDTPRSNLLSAVSVSFTNSDSKIEGTLGRNANKDITGTTVTQTRSADGTWACTVKPVQNAAGFKDKFIPTGCTKGS